MRHERSLFPIAKDGMQSVQTITCPRCGGKDRNVLTGSSASDATLVPFFRRRGWEVDERRGEHRCPECVAKEIEAVRKQKATSRMENKLTVVAAVPPSPSPNSALAKKIMSDLLFEQYDLDVQDYKPGWDDARIARESGLSEAFVAQRRGADYGPVSPPKKAVMRECAGMAQKIRLLAREVSEQAGVLKQKSDSLLMEADRLSTVLATEAEKLKASA